MVPLLASRLTGSPDLYQDDGRAPYHSINFVTSHDGFCMADLVSYNVKHNDANGEGGRDGAEENFSWNCGHEGPTDTPEVQSMRRRQTRSLAALLLIAQGVPMILAGDEFGRSQRGNNNPYCHDDETSWVDWALADANPDLLRFFKLMIRFRARHPVLRRRSFVSGASDGFPAPVAHGVALGRPDWSPESRCLAMHHRGGSRDDDLYVIANASDIPQVFELPGSADDCEWRRFVDTALGPPADILEEGHEPPVDPSGSYTAAPRSVAILIARRG
jgi:glycogen operon protein